MLGGIGGRRRRGQQRRRWLDEPGKEVWVGIALGLQVGVSERWWATEGSPFVLIFILGC